MFYQLNYKTSFCLEVITSPPHSTTLDYHGLPLWILNPRISIISSLNPCKIYRILSIILDNDDSFRVVFCLYKLFGSRLQIGRIQIRTGTTTPLVQPFLVTKWCSLPINHYPFVPVEESNPYHQEVTSWPFATGAQRSLAFRYLPTHSSFACYIVSRKLK